MLTCNWHNWKFRLEDGQCVVGGDNVRSYPVRLDDGEVWVDVTPPPAEEARRQALTGLRKAFDERDFGRICREIARLRLNGFDPKDAVRAAAGWLHDRLEFGTTHAFAATADWLAMAERFDGDFERQLICFAEAVDHMALDGLRQAVFPYALPGEPFERGSFLEAIEAEQTARAEGMVAQALADGLRWHDLEEAFAAAALAHYNDFGHSLIYVAKVAPLICSLGESVLPLLLPPLARSICYASREDRIPEFRDYSRVLATLSQPAKDSDAMPDPPVPFPLNLAKSFRWLDQNAARCSANRIYDALLTALARNMLYFDASYGSAYDRPVNDNISWLDFTHGLTFANAARLICTRHPHLWRPALLQMACFLGRNFSYLDTRLDADSWKVADAERFWADVREKLLDHGLRDPIFSSHLLKTSFAVEAEQPSASTECRQALLSSLNRFLHSPLKTKHTRRLARQAIDLVSRDFAAI
jgi:hypothetical protein